VLEEEEEEEEEEEKFGYCVDGFTAVSEKIDGKWHKQVLNYKISTFSFFIQC